MIILKTTLALLILNHENFETNNSQCCEAVNNTNKSKSTHNAEQPISYLFIARFTSLPFAAFSQHGAGYCTSYTVES